ncbi:unnamed protein product [Eruca vesicaria subsp. sativa]|uniref:RNase H type-1 domain-containing protein n=1 Tax=Eruca vesicaria subsp. sativa TaxID=29727 RepID=A0ABC8L5V1_ERUVS|nr:unnamed protein product [Eruca vesicaria subsp. sativa]
MSGFGYRNVVVETDSLGLSGMIHGEEEIWLILQPIIHDKIHMLKANLGFNVLYSVTPLWLKDVVEADMPMETL